MRMYMMFLAVVFELKGTGIYFETPLTTVEFDEQKQSMDTKLRLTHTINQRFRGGLSRADDAATERHCWPGMWACCCCSQPLGAGVMARASALLSSFPPHGRSSQACTPIPRIPKSHQPGDLTTAQPLMRDHLHGRSSQACIPIPRRPKSHQHLLNQEISLLHSPR